MSKLAHDAASMSAMQTSTSACVLITAAPQFPAQQLAMPELMQFETAWPVGMIWHGSAARLQYTCKIWLHCDPRGPLSPPLPPQLDATTPTASATPITLRITKQM